MNFILWHEGQEHGPYDMLTIQQYIGAGQLSPQMLARQEDDSQWKPLETFLPKSKPLAVRAAKAENSLPSRSKVLPRVIISLVAVAAIIVEMWMLKTHRTPAVENGELHGSVFIVSRGAETFRLSLVAVNIFTEAQILENLDGINAKIDEGLVEYKKQAKKIAEDTELSKKALSFAESAITKSQTNRTAYREASTFVSDVVKMRKLAAIDSFTMEVPPSMQNSSDYFASQFRKRSEEMTALKHKAEMNLRAEEEAAERLLSPAARALINHSDYSEELAAILLNTSSKLSESENRMRATLMEIKETVRKSEGAQAAQTPWWEIQGGIVMSSLPAPSMVTRTDVDGKYSVKLPRKGRFAIAATVARDIGGSTENLHWFVWVSLDEQLRAEKSLANDNLFQFNRPDGFIHYVNSSVN